ncbi:hypothetical protein [Pseudomonas sp. S1(2024)]|uniref:hypothetical protein n=1 Tax=Pseudomonas sp. S1(2024) TaxID=3390191 RepID=UPI003979B472
MKNYLLVSQCQGKSLRTTRRIASSFLSRLGDTTWQGTLSQEALRIMVLALKRKANQNSCIAVYDVSGRARQKVVHIGNRRRYSADGSYAFSIHAQAAKPQGNASSMMPLLSKMAALAGFLHDLGKGTVRFQDKLDYGVKYDKGLADAIRHEVVSVLMAEPLLEFLGQADLQILLDNPRRLGDWCTEHLQQPLSRFKANDQDDLTRQSSRIAGHLSTQTFSREAWARDSLLHTSILWMVLSHHHLPEGVDDNGLQVGIPYSASGGSHYFLKAVRGASIGEEPCEHSPDFNVKEFNSNLTLCTLTKASTPVAQPWDDAAWCKEMIKAYSRLRKLEMAADHYLPENAIATNNSWATALAYMGRTALVYADYMVSSEKRPGGQQRAPGAIYANTTKVLQTAVYADTLTEHLIGVGRRAEQYFAQMFIQQNSLPRSFSSLSRDERNSILPGLNKRSADERYQWQDKVRDSLKAKASNAPFFGSVMGKTGAGKTRGNIMLMHAMKEDMRFTCAIGLRSLVKQTHCAYLEPFIGMSDEHLALLVGESQGGSGQVAQDNQGTGNDLEQDANLLLGDYVIEGQSIFDHPLGRLYDAKKQRAMLSHPVQVMTVDHIMPGASLGRSSELKLLLHLMGTDIILDEIDDYPVSSQCALMRMAFVSGVFGRSFVLSSATATPIIQKAFFNAWHEGISHHRQLFQLPGAELSPRAVLVSHVAGSEALAVAPEAFSEECDRFVEAVVKEAVTNARHQIDLVDLSAAVPLDPPGRLASLYKNKYLSYAQHTDLIAQIKAAHDLHHIDAQGVSVSSGFVRFNNVRNAQHLALALNQWEDEDTLILPVCYHSQMMAMERQQIEAFLLELNCRKSLGQVGGDERILRHPTTVSAIAQAVKKGASRVIFVICTTNLLEVGRDHDYDWAILEPSSTRSMVQSCGRVWRHRSKLPPPSVANVWMLNKSVRALTGEEDELPKAAIKHLWTRFGIEDEALPGKQQAPLISMSIPLSPHSRNALDELGVEVPATLNGQMTKGTPFKKAVMGHSAILSTRRVWQDLFHTPASRVHAGLCLERPGNAATAFMPSMEAAQQHLHLCGTATPDRALNWQFPSALQYAESPVYRLTSHHPRQRRLRDPDDGYVLQHDKQQGYNAGGDPKGTWMAIDKKGEVKTQQLEVRRAAAGMLWKPSSLEVYLYGREHEAGRASRISLRKDQYGKLVDFCYVVGVGLLKKD